MIEEQHVTGYGCLSDPSTDMFECMLMHEYTECYLYWSCYNDETDERIKQIWLMHFEEELSHLHFAAAIAGKIQRQGLAAALPRRGRVSGAFGPFPNRRATSARCCAAVRLTGRAESYAEVDDLPDNFRFFSYNRAVQGNVKSLASHVVIEKAIEKFGKDYRVEDKAHPIRGLNDPKSVNADIAPRQGA